MTPDKTRLIFDHLPKTAGTSITAALNEVFGEQGGLPDISNMHFHAIRSAGTHRLMTGHLWYMPFEPLDDGWYYCTLLRDPLDRFISQYWFNRSMAAVAAPNAEAIARIADPQVRAAAVCGLEEYLDLDDPRIQRSYTNVQAAHFAQRACANPYVLADDELLAAAIASLEDYDFVGVFEDLQGFVDGICSDLGLTRVELPRLNVTSDRKRVGDTDPKLVDRLKKANRVDDALHAWALQRFRGGNAQPREKSIRESAPPAGLEFGTRELEFESVRCEGKDNGSSAVLSGESLRVVMMLRANSPIDEFTIGLAVRDKLGRLIYGSNTRLLGLDLALPVAGLFERCLVVQANLGIGEYFLTVALHKGASHLDGCYHWQENAAHFDVTGFGSVPFEGLVDLRCRLSSDAGS